MAAQYIPIKRISTLDTPIKAEKLDGSLFTTENQAHEFIISVRKNGVKQTVTGSVSGKFIRANGTTIFLQGSIVDGDAVVRLHQDCYNVQGRFTFNIFNTQSGVTTCIYSAVGKIDMGSTETVIDAGDVVPDVSDVVAAQEAAQAAITAANTAAQTANTAAQNVGGIVARPYSSSSTYTAGDYCTNNGNLYKANQEISTAEEWTASHWTQIVMGDEVTDLKSALINTAFLSGNGNTYIEQDLAVVKAGGYYKVHVCSWDTSAVTVTEPYIKFYLGYKNNGTKVRIAEVLMAETIKNDYSVQIPSDVIDPVLVIGGRVTASKQGVVNIVDVSLDTEFAETKDALKTTVGKNLVDSVTNVYFPVFIKAGKNVTWAYADKSDLVPNQFFVYFYDHDKQQVNYYGSASYPGHISRSVTPSSTTDVYYIRLTGTLTNPLQIEFGNVATDYEPYIPNNLMLADEIQEQGKYLSKYVTFSVAAGSSHSSTIDKVPFELVAGEEYGVYVKSDINSRVQLYEYNGVSNIVKSFIDTNKFYAFTSTEGASDLSLFVSAGSTNATFTLIVWRTASIAGLLQDTIPDIHPIDIGARSVEFSVNADSTHSSLNNQIDLSADEGTFLYCLATGLQGRTGGVFVRNDETEQFVANLADGIIARIKAPFDVKRLGLYVSSGTEKVNITFVAFTDKSILARLTEKTEYDNLYLTKLLNAKRKANPGNYNNQTSPEIFTLAHFSDIHGSSWAMKQVQEFKNTYQAQLDDVICTGDVVSDKITDGTAFWNDNSDGKIMICIGNHDSLGSNGWANPVDQQTLYETYIAPYEANWGAEIVNGHSYWYKDYSDKKIRLIAVDATIYDSTEQANQMTWLNTALSGAITNGYAVVGAIHFPPMPANFHKVDSNFTALLHGTAGDMIQFAWHIYHTEILQAVEQFITNGGDFVCWLSGHAHHDLVSYDDRFPKRLFITISCAMSSSLFEEKVRDSTRESGLVLNTVCVDTVRKYVKLLRYGAEWDDCLRHTGTCVIKYDANPPTVMFSN